MHENNEPGKYKEKKRNSLKLEEQAVSRITREDGRQRADGGFADSMEIVLTEMNQR